MKKILAALVAVAALTATAPALGADLGARPYYNKAPVYAAPLYNWTGFYLGGHLGGAFSGSNDFNGAVLSDSSARCWVAFRPASTGNSRKTGCSAPRASIPGSARATSPPPSPAATSIPTISAASARSQPASATLGVRAWSMSKAVTPIPTTARGLTLGGVPTAFLLNGNHSNGWTVGTGLEYMVAPNWSVKGEYMYYDFGSTRFVAPAALAPFGSFHTDDHTLKLGVNYRFNFASPVVARY